MELNSLTRLISNTINQRLLDTHTNFIGKIVRIDKNVATVQPLSMYKAYGETAVTPAILTDVPMLSLYKYVILIDKNTQEEISVTSERLKAGDTVLCAVCERDITESRQGNLSVPSTARHHNLSDAVILMGLAEVKEVERD